MKGKPAATAGCAEEIDRDAVKSVRTQRYPATPEARPEISRRRKPPGLPQLPLAPEGRHLGLKPSVLSDLTARSPRAHDSLHMSAQNQPHGKPSPDARHPERQTMTEPQEEFVAEDPQSPITSPKDQSAAGKDASAQPIWEPDNAAASRRS